MEGEEKDCKGTEQQATAMKPTTIRYELLLYTHRRKKALVNRDWEITLSPCQEQLVCRCNLDSWLARDEEGTG